MRYRRQIPVWVWTLLALSLGGVLVLGYFSVQLGNRLRHAGARIASLNQIQSQALKLGSSFGWADSVVDHYSRTGVQSARAGTGLANYRQAMADARRRAALLDHLAGAHSVEAGPARQLIAHLAAAQAVFERVLRLMRAGRRAQARSFYKTGTDSANRAVYNSIADVSLQAFHGIQRLSGQISRRGNYSRRRAWRISLAAFFLLAGYAGAFWMFSRRQAEAVAALRDSEERYRGLFENAHDMVFTLSPEGRVMTANRAWRELFQKDPDQAAVELAALAAPAGRTALSGLLTHPEPRLETLEFLLPGGASCLLEISVRKLRHHGATGFEVIARNVTERRVLEQQLSRMQTGRALSKLAAGIAHEFNNQLTVILGRCVWLRHQDQREGGRNQAILGNIMSAAESATGVVRQLQALGDGQESAPRQLDLNREIRELAPLLRRALGEPIALSLELDPDLAPIRADSSQIAQMLLHLASNAADCMPEGGECRIETHNLPRPEITALAPAPTLSAAGAAAAAIELIVRDTGPGWDAAQQAHLFEPFSTGIRLGRQGGMTLSAVYGLVRQAGGRIRVESQPGAGAAFILAFPSAGSTQTTTA